MASISAAKEADLNAMRMRYPYMSLTLPVLFTSRMIKKKGES